MRSRCLANTISLAHLPRQAAIVDLELLRDLAPEESNVVFHLARAYRLMGNETKSAQLLAVARDISPKSLNKIQRLIDTAREEPDSHMEEG
jgi:anaphase-promoting complex subunit 3